MNKNVLEIMVYAATSHNRTVYAAGAVAPLAPFGRCRSLTFWLAFPPVGGRGMERRNIEPKRQPRAHTFRHLAAAPGTSYTTRTLCAMAAKIFVIIIKNYYRNLNKGITFEECMFFRMKG
jgi:hypothetical protein